MDRLETRTVEPVEGRGPREIRVEKVSSLARKDAIFYTLLTVPVIIIVAAITGYPILYSLWMSLNSIQIEGMVWKFVGIDNYIAVARDPQLLASLIRTIEFALGSLIGIIGIGLGTALVLNEPIKGRGFLRSAILIPWAMSPVSTGILWAWLADGTYGTINGVLSRLGLIHDYIAILQNPTSALTFVTIAFIWNQAPLATLLILAGLQPIPKSLYAAAIIDGAGPLQRFRTVTFPWIRVMLMLAIVLSTINALMMFDLVYVITGGGPGDSTELFSWYGYFTTFRFFEFGKGIAICYLLTVLSAIFAFLYMKFLYKRESLV